MSRFILLSRQDKPFELDEELVRRVMVTNARYACDGDLGRQQGDPVFEEITEGRQTGDEDYSSCADLVHFCLRRLGLRDERILNRTDDEGDVAWKPAVNISRLVFAAGRAFVFAKPGEGIAGTPWQARSGDMGFVGESKQEHVFIVEGFDARAVWLPNKYPITSYDYGQFFGGKHGGKRQTRYPIAWHGRLHLFSETLPGRPWNGRLDPVELIRPYFKKGQLARTEVPDDFEGGMDNDNPY
jgi:hypothetical protein